MERKSDLQFDVGIAYTMLVGAVQDYIQDIDEMDNPTYGDHELQTYLEDAVDELHIAQESSLVVDVVNELIGKIRNTNSNLTSKVTKELYKLLQAFYQTTGGENVVVSKKVKAQENYFQAHPDFADNYQSTDLSMPGEEATPSGFPNIEDDKTMKVEEEPEVEDTDPLVDKIRNVKENLMQAYEQFRVLDYYSVRKPNNRTKKIRNLVRYVTKSLTFADDLLRSLEKPPRRTP